MVTLAEVLKEPVAFMIGLSALVGFVGVLVGWMLARRTDSKRATLEFIAKYHIHDSNWIDNFRCCRRVLRDKRADWCRLADDKSKLTTDEEIEMQKTYTVLNHFELAALGIRRKILHERTYKLWYRDIVVSKWDLAKDFVGIVRKVRRSEALFREFQELAKRWAR